MEYDENVSPTPEDTPIQHGGTPEGNITPSSVVDLTNNQFYAVSSQIGDSKSTTSSIRTQEIVFGVDKSFMMTPDPRKKTMELLDKELVDFFDRLVPDVDKLSDTPHEIFEGMASQQIRSWLGFQLMGDEIIDDMTKPHRHAPIPLSSNSVRTIRLIKQWIDERFDKEDPDADVSKAYYGDEFIKYVRSINKLKRDGIQQTMQTTSTPISKGPSSFKSIGEKKYEAWNRSSGRRTKASFEILKTDDQYRMWKPLFNAKIAHQKLSYVMDPSYDPSLLTCSYDKELWKEQTAYLWTIMLFVFKNPLGRSCITQHMDTKDPRSVFFTHHRLQEESPAKSFNTSIHLTALNEMNIKGFQGSRVDFIATWFEELRQLNELSTETLSYTMTKGLLLKALQGDPKLPDVFTTLIDTNNKATDIEVLRTTLLHQASLYDGKDKFLKTTIKAHYLTTNSGMELPLVVNRAIRGTPNPEARLSDDIFSTLDPADKQAWRQLPETTRIKFARLMHVQQRAPQADRSVYQHDTEYYTSDNNTTHSDITTDDSTLAQSVRNIIALAASTGTSKGTSFTNNVPIVTSKSPKSPASSMQSTSTPKSALKNNGKTPLLRSSIDPAHPSAILASKPIELYDKEGTYFGYTNPKSSSSSTIDLNFHRWYTQADEAIDNGDTEFISPLVEY